MGPAHSTRHLDSSIAAIFSFMDSSAMAMVSSLLSLQGRGHPGPGPGSLRILTQPSPSRCQYHPGAVGTLSEYTNP